MVPHALDIPHDKVSRPDLPRVLLQLRGNGVSVESGADEVTAYLGGVRHVIDKAVQSIVGFEEVVDGELTTDGIESLEGQTLELIERRVSVLVDVPQSR
jgi:hypothetical protein